MENSWLSAGVADAASMKTSGKAEAPQFFATLTHAAISPRCYAGGGTEIFTDGRSSIF